MSSLILGNDLMMSSKEITAIYNSVLKKGDAKEKKHFSVLEEIRNLLKELNANNYANISESYRVIEVDTLKGKETQEILLNKKLTLCLVSGWSATARMKMIEHIEKLENGYLATSQAVTTERTVNCGNQFEQFHKIALICGLTGNQAVLAADKGCKNTIGFSPLATLEIKLLTENNEKLFTPTEIGQQFQLSAIAINHILNKMGLQNQIVSKKGHKTWVLTEKGKEFGVYLDTGKSHSNGTPIQQIKWKESVIAELRP